MKRNSWLVKSICLSLLISSITFTNSASAASQKINYSIVGDCVDYQDEMGEYAFFEDEPDWECYIEVKVTPTKPTRLAKLQYWDGRKWILESSDRTNSRGYAYLDFDTSCEGGDYCDGEWKYRVYVDPASGLKRNISDSFYITYYPSTYDGWNS